MYGPKVDFYKNKKYLLLKVLKLAVGTFLPDFLATAANPWHRRALSTANIGPAVSPSVF